MAQHGLDPQNMKRNSREFSLPGGYRKIIEKPSDVQWDVIKYSDNKISLLLSDSERMEGKTEPLSLEEGELRAVRLHFTLGTSSYATMFFRELLKRTSDVVRPNDQFQKLEEAKIE
eukprot:TRINITY_DN5771_c0_g1_i4.p1 TRINITY_DN5771_c0_g1~~TRINITY_DN5771_c0_g1_i4.p1  ORF type:complete len:116 (+),score=36.09 TRINITY_DN5771_c0_g1_i4:507-854(+)